MVIYAIVSRLNHCNSFSRYRASQADSYTDRRKKKKKSEDRRFSRFASDNIRTILEKTESVTTKIPVFN